MLQKSMINHAGGGDDGFQFPKTERHNGGDKAVQKPTILPGRKNLCCENSPDQTILLVLK